MPPDVCVIVPTIRAYDRVRAYVENARVHGFDKDRLFVLLVTEDDCDTDGMARLLDDEGVGGSVFDGSRRAAWFEEHGIGEYAHLVPEASHAETSFGLLYLWANGFDYGVMLDDDTAPHDDADFFGTHLQNLQYDDSMEFVASDQGWVNVLYQHADEHGLYPRGYPYAAMGERVETWTGEVDRVVASQGLWTGVPDLDAVRILAGGRLDGRSWVRTTAGDFGGRFAAAPGNYLTVSSMNLAVRREAVPAFYQLPMDDNPWGVGRFDDIWSGVFLKRASDVLGATIVTGPPLCRHDKAPRSTFSDLAHEAEGLELNEHLWRVIDDVGGDETTFAGVYRAMADRLTNGEFDAWRNGQFLNYVGEHMREWLACLDALAADRIAATADD